MDDVFEAYPRYEYALASTQLAFAMLGMGALLSPSDFARVVRTPRALSVGLAVQLVAVPVLAAGLAALLRLEPGIAAGLVLVAAVPGGTMSNVVTYLGRGNTALSISLTAVCTIGSLVTTPALLRLFVGAHLPADFEMPVGRVAGEIGVTLLLPLATGMFLGHRLDVRREVFARWCIRVSLLAIGCMVVGGAGAGRLDPVAYGPVAWVAIFALAGVAQAVSVAASRLGGLGRSDRLAVAVEVTVRNTNLALLIKASLFPAVAGVPDPVGDGMFFMALAYGGVALLVVAPIVVWDRRALAPARPG